MQPESAQSVSTDCCIVGGGPAGLMLGYLFARAGVRVVVIEKHADFLRDFRGDTIHPSTLQIMHHAGLLEELLRLPHQRAEKLQAEVGGEEVTLADFTRLPVQCRFIAFMPQWDFLNFLARKAAELPSFTLLQSTAFDDLLYQNGSVCGIRATADGEEIDIHSQLVIGADGRHSQVREKAGLRGQSFGSPRDVLWLRLTKADSDPAWGMGHKGPKQNFIMIDRGEFWQCGYSITKGDYPALQAAGLDALKSQIADVAPFPAERLAEISDWDQLKLLVIRIDRLDHWMKPGLLCIGDAAHAMSPIGGVGVNLAIQDAVATANLLTPALRKGAVSLHQLEKVQKRRQFPTRATQFLQIKMSGKKRKGSQGSPLPRLIKRLPFLPYVFGWIIGLGFRRETPRHLR
ncbi:FAD-dependent oxidoreductase [Erwiniaceae bacterium BAC15a-03b]|uniref:FAD-dependent oxidoreductase n=1 Tax=Winslowiella arboricola TaxID=2978220 RepID=A0A9J6PY05_9GAMM|nr:FAD-dependent oxidoreductase [Winslowiella arboricola]MCU5774340.1 FAD-dependent oxidoreductase [Winslowiella arboricola]MCU5778887.1 FAD-dependent oxidoreductase [Winslowiella arboricola]